MPTDPGADRTEGDSADVARPAPDVKPIVLVGRIAESLPQLNVSELNELADAVEALTDAIGLHLDWISSRADGE